MSSRAVLSQVFRASAALAAVALIWALSRPAATPPIPGGVARLEEWDVNGTRQWLLLRGRAPSLPVLLIVAGGPGSSELATYRRYHEELERDFVVVQWEQPGAGKSHAAGGERTLERYLADLSAVARRLRREFPSSPAYAVGHSWGGFLALLSASREPDLYSAVVAVSPLVAPRENTIRLYGHVLRGAEESGDGATAGRLREWGPPPWQSEDWVRRHAFLVDRERAYFAPASAARGSAWDLLGVPEYVWTDRYRLLQGLIRTFESVWPKVLESDLRRDAASVAVPAFFFTGAHDRNTDPGLTDEYVAALRAPAKTRVVFENSGHSPHVHEPEAFRAALTRALLSR